MSLKRKAFSLLIPAVTLAFLAPVTPVSAQTERTVTKPADGIYEIQHREGAGGNTTVIIGDRQVFVVDTGFSPLPPAKTSLKSANGRTSPSALS